MASSYFYAGSERGNLWRLVRTTPTKTTPLYSLADPGRTWGNFGTDKDLSYWEDNGFSILDLNQTGSVTTEDTTAQVAGAAALGAKIGSEIGSAVGTGITARGAASALSSQAAVTEDNAHVAQFGVEQAFRYGEAQIAQIGRKQAETKARQRVAFAANGLALGVGSTAEVAASTDINAEMDKDTARMNALMRAWGYRRQRMMGFAQAKGQRLMARATRSAGNATMFAGLAGTALNAWAGYASAGTLTPVATIGIGGK